ncbi:MAG: serine hydroxymethyltransferase [Parcubacteria group bacterium]|nr:serine hydroxymethyltransferase [Parcubacteria group bacterium]
MFKFLKLKKDDSKLADLIFKETDRQRRTLDLIPSENFVFSSMLEAIGSPLMNKYSEGYPGKRYYPGNFYYDKIEKLAQERARKVFNLNKNWHINVQPYSGTPANIAIYLGLLNFNDKIMGMKLSAGGHLSHGHNVSFSGRGYKVVHYGVDLKNGFLNYTEIEKLAKKHKPKMIICGATAYPRIIDFQKFSQIAKKVGAYLLADISHIAGLVAAKIHPSPFPFADVVMTTTHKTLRGPRGAVIFCKKELGEKIDKAVFPGLQGGPHNNTIAGIALAFHLAKSKNFINYQKQILKNAGTLAKSLKNFGFDLVTGGTDNHLILIDLKNIGINGFEAEKLLERAGIIANRNTIPSDVSAFRPSGLRLGTPALTSRGMKEKEMKRIAFWIYQILILKKSPEKIKKEVEKMAIKFILPGIDE